MMWEVVARLHVRALADGTPAASWIVPASEGRRIYRSQLAARMGAWRMTRHYARVRLEMIAAADAGDNLAAQSMARMPAWTWEARPYGPKHRRAPFSR